jgi:hypothetical protein
MVTIGNMVAKKLGVDVRFMMKNIPAKMALEEADRVKW